MLKKIAEMIGGLQNTAGRECELIFRVEASGLLMQVRVRSLRVESKNLIIELPELGMVHRFMFYDIYDSKVRAEFLIESFMASAKKAIEKAREREGINNG